MPNYSLAIGGSSYALSSIGLTLDYSPPKVTMTNTWSESVPAGSALASTLNEIICQLKLDIRDRLATSSVNFNSGILTITGGLTVPRLTTVEKNALTPINGMIVYDVTLNKFQGFEGSVWVNLI